MFYVGYVKVIFINHWKFLMIVSGFIGLKMSKGSMLIKKIQDNVNSPIVTGFTKNWISEENWPSKRIYTSYLEYIQITHRTYELCKFTSIHLLYLGLYKGRNGHWHKLLDTSLCPTHRNRWSDPINLILSFSSLSKTLRIFAKSELYLC